MDAQEILQREFGYAAFKPGQAAVIEALGTQRAALAVFPTGGGKSLCYQLPALLYDGVTVVVSPLIALMKDQIDALLKRGIAAARLDSSLSASEAAEVHERLRAGTLKILYIAPERFNNERFLTVLQQTKIALFAVDEAHCISEWGHNFRPDYLKLAETAQQLGVERVLALTATATPAVVQDICTAFAIPSEGVVLTGFYRHNLTLYTTPVSADKREAALRERLKTRPPGPTIIYVTLQKTANILAASLQGAGFPVRAYHAGLESEARSAVQEWWMASDRHIVVATIAFGMGIDKADVRYVYHYNLPKSLESYSQEIGRAGRDDLPAIVEMLACHDDVPTLENFAYGDTPPKSALHHLVKEILASGPEFAVNLFELSNRHDIRPLVLRTIMTYLELRGVLKQGTPFYAGYEMRPLIPVSEIIAQFQGEPAELVQSLFTQAKQGRLWYALNPDLMAEQLGKERRRIVRALDYLSEHGWVELKASDVRQRYMRLHPSENEVELVAELSGRFSQREAQEIRRLQQVLELVTQEGCQINALVGYFGQQRATPCGHCTFCLTGRRQSLPEASADSVFESLNHAEFTRLRAQYTDALGDSRQAARFLCGLSSPALSRAKLSKNALFGIWEDRRFGDVLAWCSASSGAD